MVFQRNLLRFHVSFRGCTQYEDSRHLTVRCVDPQSNVELFSWWILTGENHGKSPLISPPFLERISVELFVQATKQQANPSVYHNRFCVYSPTKCTKPKGNSTEEVWPFKKQVKKANCHLNSPQKIHWPQLLKHSGFYVSMICWARVRLYKSWCGSSGVSLMDLGKFDRHFRSPVWPRLLDVQGEYRNLRWTVFRRYVCFFWGSK